jgi:hypothetical protein
VIIEKSAQDEKLLCNLIDKGIPPAADQPKSYRNLVVMKPWGYEFEVFSNVKCALWLACLRPREAVSLHCHRRKRATFTPLSEGIRLVTHRGAMALNCAITVGEGVFHSQENATDSDVFFLEYESSPDKTDLIRASDRYGRTGFGYEGKGNMIPFWEAVPKLHMPDPIRFFIGKAA